jgi:glycosyltransferase involved in cell wall biosynthesis
MPHRRLEDAIEAVAEATSRGSRVRLLLAGSDRSYPGYVHRLKQLVAARGLKYQVTFTGQVAEEEIRDYYAACDAFLFPNDKQTWGLVVLEAMACGCLTIVSRGAGVHEILTDAKNSILFQPRNVPQLASKIELLANAPDLRRKIARAGTTLAREVYTVDHFAEEIEQIFEQRLMPASIPLRTAV